ncbi:hypothetical protein GCM10018793_35520 [Streptomyces sulfonofaciens]|uniref:Uncharacterized protein n=1 Tax=Streptomyces sulfonofaciens TaxID=68272 RepID=A0A919L1Y9_9ACTN|nr:hypothetical protein [Streptomyces sulfonofaciens]GHH80409.1 hypothetical protein GCM10018793_35520 [Streptomyces sulfonofaciens]
MSSKLPTGGQDPTAPRTLALTTGYLAGYLTAAGGLTRVTMAGAVVGLLAWLNRR